MKRGFIQGKGKDAQEEQATADRARRFEELRPELLQILDPGDIAQFKEGATSLDVSSESVALRNGGISNAGEIMAKALKCYPSITKLDFRGFKMNTEGARNIVVILEAIPLKELRLMRAQLSDEEAGIIAKALLTNNTLTILDLSTNSIGDPGAACLAAALKHNSTLTKLVLYNNRISQEGIKAFAKGLEQNFTLLTLELYLKYEELQVKVGQILIPLLERNLCKVLSPISENLPSNIAKIIAEYVEEIGIEEPQREVMPLGLSEFYYDPVTERTSLIDFTYGTITIEYPYR